MEKRSLCCRGSHVRRFIEKLLKMPKKAKTKLTSDNHQWKSLFLIHLPTSSKIFCNWMFFSFVSLITNRGFFLIWLGNSLWLRVWRHDELKDDAGIYFYDSNFGGRWPRSVGRGPWAEENQDPFCSCLLLTSFIYFDKMRIL